MKRRDLAWRGIGLAVLMAAIAVQRGIWFAPTPFVGISTFVVAVTSIVLLVQGRRVAAALRIEFSNHRILPQMIRNRRLPRS